MTASLTTLISRVQAALLDDGTRYSTATVTAALRQALKEYNAVAPRFAAETIAAVTDQNEYELTGGDFDTGVLGVTSVHLFDDDGDDDDDNPLAYRDYLQDNRQYIRLTDPQPTGEYLLVGFTTPNTINGLDSATESTIQNYYDQVLVDGGAYYAITIRSAGRVEPINLNKDVPKVLQETAQRFLAAFEAGKREAGRQKPRPAKLDTTWDFNPTSY